MMSSYSAIIGQSLLWIGFMGGAVCSVVRLENTESPWETVPWMIYLGCAAVGVVGVVMLRADRSARRDESAASEAGLDSVGGDLQQAASLVSTLASRLDDMTCEEVLEYIDGQCTESMGSFAEGRMVISNRYGTAVYAAVMTEFASGERYLNRAWSAAADGYVDEVKLSVEHARDFLNDAVEQFNAPTPDGSASVT